MTDFTSVDSISKVFIETEEFRDYPLRPLFTLCSVYAGEAIASDDLSDEKIVPVYGSNGIRAYTDKPNHLEDQVLVGRQGSVGTVHFAKAPFWAAEHALVVEPRTSEVSKQWLKYILETLDLSRLSRAVAQPGINASSVSFQRVPTISLGQQKAIADYLDRETAEIDAAVADLDRYVELLEKRHLEMIRHKTQFDSHGSTWKRCSTSILFRSIGGGTTPKKDMDYYTSNEDANGIPWVTTSELRESVLQTTKVSVTPKALREVPSLRIHPTGSVAIAMYGATIGRLGILGIPATTNQACCVFSEPRGLDLKFFYYSLWADRDAIIRYSSGGGQPNISQAILQRWKTPLPPLEAQREIVDYLDRETAEIDALITESTRLRDLLLKRRFVLITDVVTGRKQV